MTTPAPLTAATHPFLAGLSSSRVALLSGMVVPLTFPAGTWIARAGTPADHFHLVLAGRAGIELAPADREPLVVATVHGGDVLGWSWFVEPYRWTFDVIALDDVQTAAIDAAALRNACAGDHELGYQLARRLTAVVAARLEATRHQLLDIYGSR